MRIGFVTGIRKEEKLLRRNLAHSNYLTACSNAQPNNAYTLAMTLLNNGCKILVSFGVAGGLDPSLKAGDIVCPNSVIGDDNVKYIVDKLQHKTIVSHFSKNFKIAVEPLFSTQIIIANTAEKQRLYQTYNAALVDMESLGVAKAAKERNCPFVVIRSIADTATQNLPASSIDVINRNGNIQANRVVMKLIKNPKELPNLLKLASNSTKAFISLKHIAKFGFGL